VKRADGEIFICDRCRTEGVAKSPRGPREYVLRDDALKGGPVFHFCKSCRMKVENFMRGIDAEHC
jgi:hypothetical protein